MDLRKSFSTDNRMETEGIDIHLGGGAYITLARAGGSNVRYENSMRKQFAPHRRALSSNTLDEKTANEILIASYAESVVLGWRGIELDGEEFAYSPANARRLLTEFPEVWRIVQEEATKFANYRAEEIRDMGEG